MKNKMRVAIVIAVISSFSIMGCGAKTETTEVTTEVIVDDTEATAEEKIEEVQDEELAESKAVLYVTLDHGETYIETPIEVEGELTAEYLLEQMSEVTGWNLDLADEVTSGSGGMTVSFAKTSALYVGPPEPQEEAYYVFDSVQLCSAILDSVKHTLQQNFVDTELGGDPEALDIYYCGEGDTELYLESADGTVSMTEPYTEITFGAEETTAILYYPDDELQEMLEVETNKRIEAEQELYEAWEAEAKLDTGTQVLSFDGTTLDISNQFSVFINQFGTSGETMYIDGLVKTFKEYYGISEIYLTIEGNVLETGHNIYDYAL